MPQVTLSIEVDVPPEKLFDVIVDFDTYSQFLSNLGLHESRILSKSDETVEVESLVKKMGFSDKYTLKYKLNRPNDISWTLVKGKLTKETRAHGSWKSWTVDGQRQLTAWRPALAGWFQRRWWLRGSKWSFPNCCRLSRKRPSPLNRYSYRLYDRRGT